MVKNVEIQNDNIISDQNFLRDKISSLFDELDAQRQQQKKDIKEVEKDTDRDNYLSAEDALAYGLIDKIYKTR